MVLTLTYFDGRGLGELARLLLKYGDVEFVDNRIATDKWPELKPSTPFGQMPLLEKDGVTIWQSGAINKYVAKLVKLAGDNDWESAQIDAIVETLVELRTKITPYFYEQDEAKKAKLQETAVNETIPVYFDKLEAIAKNNNGHLALNKLTWADFALVHMFDILRRLKGPEAYSKWSTLQKIVADVENIPNVKKWIESRPETKF